MKNIMAFLLAANCFASHWSFEDRAPQEMNDCEVIAWKYSLELISQREQISNKDSLETFQFETLKNFLGVLNDIKQAKLDGILTPEMIQYSGEVNLNLLMYAHYATRYHIEDILNNLEVLRSEFPEFFIDVCQE